MSKFPAARVSVQTAWMSIESTGSTAMRTSVWAFVVTRFTRTLAEKLCPPFVDRENHVLVPTSPVDPSDRDVVPAVQGKRRIRLGEGRRIIVHPNRGQPGPAVRRLREEDVCPRRRAGPTGEREARNPGRTAGDGRVPGRVRGRLRVHHVRS